MAEYIAMLDRGYIRYLNGDKALKKVIKANTKHFIRTCNYAVKNGDLSRTEATAIKEHCKMLLGKMK